MGRLERGIYGVFWGFALVWVFVCAWSFWRAELGLLEGVYFALRDWAQPEGYALGRLRYAPTWGIFHILAGMTPAALLFTVRSLLTRD